MYSQEYLGMDNQIAVDSGRRLGMCQLPCVVASYL